MATPTEQKIQAIFSMIQANVSKIIEHQESGHRYTMFPGEVHGDGEIYAFSVEVLDGRWEINIKPCRKKRVKGNDYGV